MPTLTLAEAQNLVVKTLIRCKTDAGNAESVARALVAAEADGLKGHGLSRLPSYAAQAKVGKVDIDLALATLPAITRANGIAAAGIRRSHHCGAAGHPVEKLATEGLVALMFANTPAAIAPWGGARGIYGTNPIAFACPLPGAEPIVVDLSLSKVARGNILAAKQRGERIPEGWALGPDGKPTTDPDAALAGTMLPLGDAKGTALALMVELLSAGLTASHFGAEASSFLDAKGEPPSTGQLLIAIDPAGLAGADALSRFGDLAAMITDQDGARLPGARRRDLRQRAAADGISVPDDLMKQIAAVAGQA